MPLIKKRDLVVKKINNIVEYKDIYCPETKKIEITEVIRDGNSIHISAIIKMIKVISSAVKDYNINIKILETVALLHDIGKKQPALTVGETVDIMVFEHGEVHAHRSAEICTNFIHADDCTSETIRKIIDNHHTKEEFWTNFSEEEKIHCRIFKLLDCLSAGVTRRQSKVYFDYIGNGNMLIEEISNDSRYNGLYSFNFFESEKLIPIKKEAVV